MREDRGRYVVRDRLEDRPAALAGIGDPAFDVREIGPLLRERALGELEEPGAYDAALQPHARDALGVDPEFACVDELEALAIGLHHPVLDPVVDHPDEVARAALSEMRPTA